MRCIYALALLQAVSLTWTPSTTPNTTTNVNRDGTQIASGLTTASYTDSTVTPGSHSYNVTATAGGATSGPSNTITVSVPTPQSSTPIGTMIGFGTSTINQTLTRVTINVSAVSGKVTPTGTITWAIGGQTIFTDTLLKNGRDAQDIWTILLKSSIPVTITYSGDANFAASSVALP